MQCERCCKGEEARYCVYTEAMEMAVCVACADEARQLGISVERRDQERIEQRYTCDAHGIIAVEMQNQTCHYARRYHQTTVICRYFGLEGRPAETLAQIGRDCHLSRERVRQIVKEALAKLKRHKAMRLVSLEQ